MIRKFFASIFVVLFLTISVFAILIFSLDKTFLNPDFYKENLLEGLYDASVSVATERLLQPDLPISKYYVSSDLSAYIKELLPFDIFSKEVSSFIDRLIEWDFMSNESLTIPISLAEIKSRVSEVAPKLIDDLFVRVPKCGPSVNATSGPIPDCIPANMSKNQIVSYMNEMIYGDFFKTIPDVYNFTLPQIDPNTKGILAIAVPIIKVASSIMVFVLLVVASLIALILWKPLSRVFRWEGVTFILAGLQGLVCAFSFKYLPDLVLRGQLSTFNLPDFYNDGIFNVVSLIFGFFADAMILFSGIFVIIGIIFVVFPVFLKKR